MTNTEETPPLQADLPDVLRMIARIATVPRLGRDFRRIALALANAGHDLDRMDGLVIDGETYSATYRKEWATCRCGDGKHEERRDAPPGRGAWQRTRREADHSLAGAVDRWEWARAAGRGRNPKPHLVTQIVAVTSTEAVR